MKKKGFGAAHGRGPVPFLAVAVSCPNSVSPTEKNGQFAYFPIIRLTIRPTIIHITHIDIVPNKR